MKTKILSKAATGDRVQTSDALDSAVSATIAVKAADRLNLHSPQAVLIARKRIGRDLSLEFDDGQSVLLDGFYTPGAEAAPSLVVSTGEISEIYVGAADGTSEVAEGFVNGKLLSALGTGEYADGGDGELFSGSPPYISAQIPNGHLDATADVSDADTQPLAAGNGASAGEKDQVDNYWGILAAFVPLFFAAADMAQVFGASATADDGAKSPTVWIDAISTDTGESNADFITSDTTLTLNGHVTELANGQRLQVSSDGGITWADVAVPADGKWSYEDPNAHGESFTYQARIINSENGVLSTASQAVTVDTHASGEPGSNDGVAVSITAVNDDVTPLTGTVANGGITDDSAPTVSGTLTGTLAAGEVIAIYRDNIRVGAATLSGNSWSFTDAGLSTGDHTYQARVEDVAGNQGAVSGTYSITVNTLGSGGGGSSDVLSVSIAAVNDDVAPITGTVAGDGATNDTSPTLSGTLTGTLGAGDVIAIYRNGSRIGTATLSGNSWSFTDSGLADGSYNYQARVEDVAGNQAAASSVYGIIVDTHVSGVPGSNDGVSVSIAKVQDDVAPFIGTVSNGGVTNDKSPALSGSFTGSLAADEVIAIYRDTIRIGTATISGDSWSYADVNLPDGVRSYVARVEDAAGNQGAASGEYKITVDTVAPGVSVTITAVTDNVAPGIGPVANNGATNDTTPTLSGAVSGALAAGEVVAVYRGTARAGTAVLNGTTWTFTDSSLADGTYIYQAHVEDAAGNQGAASPSHTITVDTTAPVLSVAITAVTDNVDPITGTVANNGVTDDTTPTLNGTLSGTLAAGEVIAIYRDTTRIGTATLSGSTWTFADSGLADGEHTYLARVEDVAGNQGAASENYTITVDTQVSGAPGSNDGVSVSITAVNDDVAPITGTVTNGGATDDTSPTLSGTLTGTLANDEVIAIYRDTTRIGTATLSGSNWSYADSELADGSYSYQAYVEDSAGNQSGTTSGTYAITVDTHVSGAPGSNDGVAVSITAVADDVAPITGTVTNGGATDDTSPTLSGTLTGTLANDEVIAVYRDTTRIGTATLSGSTWTFADSGLADGEHTYLARVEDATGNQGAASNVYAITVYTAALGVSVTITAVTDNVDPITGTVANNGVTDDTTPTLNGTLSGTLAAGEVIAIYRDTTRIGTATLSGSTWTFADSGLADGEHTYLARVEDVAGNQGAASGEYKITVDTHASDESDGVFVSIDAVADDVAPVTGTVTNGGATDDTSPELNGTLDGTLAAGEVIAIYRDGVRIGEASLANGNWSFTDSGLINEANGAGGSHTYMARVEDLAGNQGATSDGYTITVDISATADLAITRITEDTGSSASDFNTSDTTLSVSGTNEVLGVGDRLQVSSDGVTWHDVTDRNTATTWNFDETLIIAHAESFTYSVRVLNAAGDVVQTASRDVIIDTTPPPESEGVAITAITNDTGSFDNDFITRDTVLELSGTNDTLSAGHKIQVSSDNGVTWAFATVTGNTWSYSDPATHEADFTYDVRVVDIAGNVGVTASQTVKVDIDASQANITIDSITDNAGAVTGTVDSGGTTDDTSPELNGTLDGTLAVGEVIAVYRDGVRIGEASLADGTWSFTDSELANGADGPHTYVARVEDIAGNQGADSNGYDIILDTSGTADLTISHITDDTGSSAFDFITRDTSLTVSGTNTALNGGKVQVSIDETGNWQDATITGNTWSYIDLATHAVDFTYKVRVLNAAGDVVQTASRDVIIDTTPPPESEGVAITAITNDTGSFENDFITRDTVLELSGTNDTLSAGHKIQVSSDNGVTWAFATVTGNTWSYSDPATHEADFTYDVRVIDIAGNVGKTDSRAVTVDTTPPSDDETVAITSISEDGGPFDNDFITNDTLLEVNGTNTLSVGSEIQVSSDNGATWAFATVTGNTWRYTDPTTHAADFTYLVRVVDIAGNVGKTASQNVKIDTHASDVSDGVSVSIDSITDNAGAVTGTVDSGGTTDDTSPELNGTLDGTLAAGEVIAVYRDGVRIGEASLVSGNWSFTDSGLADGLHNYQARVEDLAGNQGAASTTYAIMVETSAPLLSVAIDSITDNVERITGTVVSGGLTNDTSPTLIGTLDGNLASGEAIAIYRNGTRIGTASLSNGNWSFTDSGLADGLHDYQARVEDLAGNQGAASTTYAITVDTHASDASNSVSLSITAVNDNVSPITGTVANGGATNDTSPTLSGSLIGTLAAGEVIAIYRNSVRVGAATLSDTSWSFTDSALVDGDHTYQAYVEDLAGNQGAASTTYAITVDTHASDVSNSVSVSITAVNDNVSPITGTVANGGATNDTSPTLSGSLIGTLAAGEVIAIYRNSVRVGAAALSGGNWSFTDGGLSDGSYNYQAVVEDLAGNQGASSGVYAFTVDTHASDASDDVSVSITAVNDNVAPITGTVANGGVTNDTSPTLNGSLIGTLATGEVIAIYRDDVRVGAAIITGGNWNFTDSGLADGSYSYKALVEDLAGNQGATSSTYAIAVATHASDASDGVSISITAVNDDVARIIGTVAPGGATNDTSPSLSGSLVGTLKAGEVIAIYRNGARLGAADVSGGNWSFTDSGLADGSYSYQGRVEDLAGNQGAASNFYAIKLDTHASDASNGVSVFITAVNDNVAPDTGPVASGGSTNDTSPTLSGTFAGTLDTGEVIAIYRDSIRIGTASLTGSNWTYFDSGLADGNYSYQALVEDLAGNHGASSDAYDITVDTSGTTEIDLSITAVNDDMAPVTGTVANGGATNDTTPTLSGNYTGTLQPGDVVAIYRDGNRIGTASLIGKSWNFTDISLTDGDHTYQARVEDLIGAQRAITDDYIIKVDTIAPDASETVAIAAISSDTGVSATDFHTSDTTLIVSGTNTALSADSRIQVSSDNGGSWSDAAVTGSAWSYADPVVHPASFTYIARVVDTAGNVGQFTSQAVTVDITPPNQPTIAPSRGDQVHGTADAGVVVRVFTDGTLTGTTTANGQGQWTYDLNPDAVHGTIIGAQAEDIAGNLSAEATTTVDLVATIQIDSTLMGDNIFNNTEANSVQVSGTSSDVEPGRIVQLSMTDSMGSVFPATTTVKADGTWTTMVNLLGASHGVIGITATVTDLVGNAASAGTGTLQYAPPVDIVAINEDLGISATDFLTADNELELTGTADPAGIVTLTGSVRFLGEDGNAQTYDVNQVVIVDPDGTWRALLVFGEEMDSLAGLPITLLDTTVGQPSYSLTATWSSIGAGSFSDTATVSVDSVAPDILVQAVGASSERQVNTYANSHQVSSRVVGLADGGYVVVWTSMYQDTTTSSNVGLYGQRYDAEGNRVNGEFRINTTIASDQGRLNTVDWTPMFDLVTDPTTGGFAVVWTSTQKGGSYDVNTPSTITTGGARNIFGQRYDANGVQVTTDIDGSGTAYGAANEFIVNSSWDNTTTNALLPRAINLDNGNFAVVWVSNANATAGMGYDLRAQLFNASWQRVGGEIAVTNERYNQGYWPESDSNGTNVDIDNLTVTAKSGGGFTVTWSGTDPALSSSSVANANIYSASFNSAGAAVGSRVQVNTGVTGNQLAPVSTTLEDGSSVVAWISSQTGNYDVYSQRYDAAGSRIGVETRVNVTLTGSQGTLSDIQKELAVTALGNGGYVVVWAGRGSASTTDDNVYMRVYSAAGTALSSQDTVINQSIKGTQMLPGVAALQGGGFIVTWSSQYGGTDQGSDYAVMQRAYNDDGTLRPQALDTPELLANVGATLNSQYGTSVSASSVNRNVAVSWTARSSTGGYAVNTTETTKAALFDLGGRKLVDLSVANIAGDDGSFSGIAGKGAQILSLSNGNYVLVREAQSATTGGDVWASIYGANGALVKADFLATSTNVGEQSGPAGLIELKDSNGAPTGQWVVLYIGKTAQAPMQPQFGIFKANGDDALPTPDIVVSQHGLTASQGYIGSGAWEATAHMASSKGRFAIVWSDAVKPSGGDASGDAVYMRIFSNEGTGGTELQVNVQTLNNQSAPKVAGLADGSFLVTWVSNHTVSTAYDVYMQRFAADGTRLSAADQLVTGGFTTGNQGVYGTANAERAQHHDVIALAGGGWVVSFVDNSTGSRNVLANIYDAAGNLMSSNLQLASVFSGTEEYYPSLTPLANGGFVASWTSTNLVLGDSSGTGTYMRYFDESGNVRSFDEFEPGGNPVVIEPGLLIGGSANADAYNVTRKTADPTFDIATEGMNANGDTPSTLWKAEVKILNYQQGDVLAWDPAKTSAAGMTATYDGAGHLVMVLGAATTINGIETVLRSVTYSGGATPAAGDRAIQFVLTDKAGATSTQDSGVTVESPALGVTGTSGNDVLAGGNGNDGIVALGGTDTVHGGNGDDRIYVTNTALDGQYHGDQGQDTLVLNFTGTQSVNLSALVGHAHGVERIDLGNTSFLANSTSLRIDDLSNITSIVDAGISRLLVQGGTSDTVKLANTLNLAKVAVSSLDHVNFDIYQAAGSDIQLWLQQGMAVSQVV